MTHAIQLVNLVLECSQIILLAKSLREVVCSGSRFVVISGRVSHFFIFFGFLWLSTTSSSTETAAANRTKFATRIVPSLFDMHLNFRSSSSPWSVGKKSERQISMKFTKIAITGKLEVQWNGCQIRTQRTPFTLPPTQLSTFLWQVDCRPL